jgi:hypothetical protein
MNMWFDVPAIALIGPAVYGWFRGDRCLYIGQSIHPYLRTRQHHIINAIEPVNVNDRIRIWRCDAGDLMVLEAQLIKKYNPTFNKSHPNSGPWSRERRIIEATRTLAKAWGISEDLITEKIKEQFEVH